MNKIKKGVILGLSTAVLGSATLVAVPLTVDSAMASHRDYGKKTIHRNWDKDKDFRFVRDRKFHKKYVFKNYKFARHHRFTVNRPVIIIVRDNRDYRYVRHYPVYLRGLDCRELVFVNRYDRDDRIIIKNTRTGAFSVNRIYVDVDRHFFTRLNNTLSIDQDIDIDVNTGNNTASFNTGSGIIRTGDVDVSID